MVGASAGSKNFALWLGPGSRCACPGRRGERATLSVVVARLDRAIQYSRDACDQAERPACTGCPAFAGHDGEGRRDSTFSRHEMSEVLEMNRPRNQKRAQRMPDARSTHGRLCSKKAQASATTGTPQSTGIPCAMVLTVSSALSSVTGLFCHRRQWIVSTNLAPASGRQDHTASPSAQPPLVAQRLRPAMCVHRIPLPTSVTIASRPSYECETGESIVLICPTRQCQGRAADWHDGQIDHTSVVIPEGAN